MIKVTNMPKGLNVSTVSFRNKRGSEITQLQLTDISNSEVETRFQASFSANDSVRYLLCDSLFFATTYFLLKSVINLCKIHDNNNALLFLLADIFLYSYEAEFIQSLLSAGKKRLASQFNFTYRYIDDVLSINNPDFENYLGQMYPPELEIKDTTESNTSASYLDLLLSIGRDGQLRTSTYDKRDDFNFHITNFPFLSSNIPSSPAYGVFISQLIRYARACSSYECFILRAMRLSIKLLGQGYVKERLKSSLRKFYGRYGDLTKQYEVPLSRMLHDILDDDHIQWHPPLIGHYTNFWPLLIWTLLPNLTFYLIG